MSVERGMRAMLELRAARLAEGDRHLGWKVGFGAPAAMERLGIERPLAGFLTHGGLLPDGARVRIGGWTTPMLEPEIAVHFGEDLAIAGLSAAIELADVHPPPEDPETVLAGNIFHRHVLLGPVDAGRRDAGGITARLVRDGEEVARTDAPEELIGPLADVIAATAETLEAAGERLRPGDVVITGTVLPPLAVAPGQTVRAELGPLGGLTVELTG
jgi:2-keto-4-pentenoate hydratase